MGCTKTAVLVISVAISSETLELRPTLLYSDKKYFVCFPMALKCVTLNDLEMSFYVNIVFCVGLPGHVSVTFNDNYVKAN